MDCPNNRGSFDQAPSCQFVPASNAGQPWCSKVGRHAVDSPYLAAPFEWQDSVRISDADMMTGRSNISRASGQSARITRSH